MARVTVEDVSTNPQPVRLVLLAASGAEVSGGAEITIDRDRDKNPSWPCADRRGDVKAQAAEGLISGLQRSRWTRRGPDGSVARLPRKRSLTAAPRRAQKPAAITNNLPRAIRSLRNGDGRCASWACGLSLERLFRKFGRPRPSSPGVPGAVEACARVRRRGNRGSKLLAGDGPTCESPSTEARRSRARLAGGSANPREVRAMVTSREIGAGRRTVGGRLALAQSGRSSSNAPGSAATEERGFAARRGETKSGSGVRGAGGRRAERSNRCRWVKPSDRHPASRDLNADKYRRPITTRPRLSPAIAYATRGSSRVEMSRSTHSCRGSERPDVGGLHDHGRSAS